ncbi:MAG: aspartate aminotransferase, partial [Deltaproteobacteria bacterium]
MSELPKSAIHEMTRLSKEVDDVSFLSWAKPTSAAPGHIAAAAVKAIEAGLVDGYSESSGMLPLRQAIAD